MNLEIHAIFLSIIIPFKNEKIQIEKSLTFFKGLESENVELVFVNDGSTDGGEDVIKKKFKTSTILATPSVGTGKAFLHGMKNSRGQYSWLLPVDCFIKGDVTRNVYEKIRSENGDVYVFPKKYTGENEMKIYSFFQNMILLKGIRLAAWTNGFVLKNSLVEILEKSNREVFLVDLELSKQLKKKKWIVLDEELIVSTRKYKKDGYLKRIFMNGVIVSLWIFKLVSSEKLLQLYRTEKK